MSCFLSDFVFCFQKVLSDDREGLSNCDSRIGPRELGPAAIPKTLKYPTSMCVQQFKSMGLVS
jgi:hypothetical protein